MGGEEVQLPTFLTSVQMSTSHPSHFPIEEKTPITPRTGARVTPRAGLDVFGKEKNLLLIPGIEPSSL
jgi:hypothetical protein